MSAMCHYLVFTAREMYSKERIQRIKLFQSVYSCQHKFVSKCGSHSCEVPIILSTEVRPLMGSIVIGVIFLKLLHLYYIYFRFENDLLENTNIFLLIDKKIL